ncbi:MAG: hypothetical protein M0Q43_02320 [Methanothrix sp.]|nr:hypothetical protein [Methanothrix sp.]
MNNRISICILLCLAILASGQAAAQQTYGTKVNAGDPDVGLPLSNFAAIGIPPQNGVYVSYWDLNANGIYDGQDVPYLQFGSSNTPGLRFVQASNIRLTEWESYPAGSYVKPTDSDMGKPLITTPPNLPSAWFPNGPVSFYYLDVVGSTGYDLGDPVYLKVLSPTFAPINGVGTNDIRITANAGFPAGSKVSLNDPDAGKPLTFFKLIPFAAGIQNAGGPFLAGGRIPIAQLAFYNANGNTNPAGFPIYDDGDVVYFDIAPGNPANPIVSPNDIRLY